jgi:hypothetical protein
LKTKMVPKLRIIGLNPNTTVFLALIIF